MIGKKKTSKCSVCTNTTVIMPIQFAAGTQYGHRLVVITPLLGRMISNGDMNIQQNFVGCPSAFMDYGFRKILTMFTQIRVKGCYIRVVPMMNATQGMDFVTMWSCWEKKAKNGDWNMYGGVTAQDPNQQAAARKVKAAAQLQGKKGMTLNITKGFFAYETKCTPVGREKGDWMDATCTVQDQVGIGKNWHEFELTRPFGPGAGATFIGFNPMCFLAFEAPIATTANTTVLFRIEMRTYLQLRYPGCTIDDTTAANLLRTNESLIPWVPAKQEPMDQDDDDDDTLTH